MGRTLPHTPRLRNGHRQKKEMHLRVAGGWNGGREGVFLSWRKAEKGIDQGQKGAASAKQA